MKFNTNLKKLLKGEDFNCIVNIVGHNGLTYIPSDFMTCIFHIYTSNKNTYIVCTIDNGRLTVSTNGQYYIQIDAADLQELDYGQLRWKMTYEILHNQQPNHVLEGTEYGGVDTYLVSEIINN